MNKLEQLKQWAQTYAPVTPSTLLNKIEELQSQAPDNLEGYLKESDTFDSGKYILRNDALAALQQLADDKDAEWKKLADIAPPEKWIKAYEHYQELLQREDVADFWQREFEMMSKQKEQLQSENERLRQYARLTNKKIEPPKQ